MTKFRAAPVRRLRLHLLLLAALLACFNARTDAQGRQQERAAIEAMIRRSASDAEGLDSAQRQALLGKALTIARQAGLPEAEGDVFTAQAFSVYEDPAVSWDLKAGYYRQASAAYRRAGAWEKAVNAEAEVAKVLENSGHPEQAVQHLDTAIAGIRKHDERAVPQLYGYLGVLYMRLGDQARSIRYGVLAVQTGEAAGKTGRTMSDIYNNIAFSYYGLMQFDSAYNYLRKAITEAEQSKDTGLIFDNYFNLVTLLPDLGRAPQVIPLLDHIAATYPISNPQARFKLYYQYTDAWLERGEAGNAAQWFSQLKSLEPSVVAVPELNRLFQWIAIRYYIATRNYEPARDYLAKRNELIMQNYSLREHWNNERFWFIVDSATGNYLPALRHYQMASQLMDSIFSVEKTQQLNELQVSYQTAAKDKDISLLRQSAQLKDATIQKQGIIRNLIILGALLLLALLIVALSRYQLKQRINRQLEQKQEEINAQNDVLKGLLKDKEWLLKEIHHRVKNNLQIVISLLNTQSAYLDNEQGLSAITDSQHRMQAMSLIHQRLYQSDDMGLIDMNWYIGTLVTHMQESYSTGSGLAFRLDVERIELDVAQAVPAGLILNEAISNAIKYAFPNGRKGVVSISLKRTDTGSCELVIADNGVGLPEAMDAHTSDSLGMSLMIGLSGQLGGTFSLETDGGTRIVITFAIQRDPAAGRAAEGNLPTL